MLGSRRLSSNSGLDIAHIAAAMNTEYRTNSSGDYELKHCHFCSKGNKDNHDNLWKLVVRENASYYCYRCSQTGGRRQFNDKLEQFRDYEGYHKLGRQGNAGVTAQSMQSATATTSPDAMGDKGSRKPKVKPDQRLAFSYTAALLPLDETLQLDHEARRVMNYLNNERGLQRPVLLKYGVGCAKQQFPNEVGVWEDKVCVTFPWFVCSRSSLWGDGDVDENGAATNSINKTSTSNPGSWVSGPSPNAASSAAHLDNREAISCVEESLIARLKYRALDTKGLQRILPKGGVWGLFGWHTVRL
jgi:twinkle protein